MPSSSDSREERDGEYRSEDTKTDASAEPGSDPITPFESCVSPISAVVILVEMFHSKPNKNKQSRVSTDRLSESLNHIAEKAILMQDLQSKNVCSMIKPGQNRKFEVNSCHLP